jgi:hypothetical protein
MCSYSFSGILIFAFFFCYRLADAHKISIEKSKYLGGWFCDANAILLLEGNDFPFYGE